MVREQLSRFLGVPSTGLPGSLYPDVGCLRPDPGTAGQEAVKSVLMQAFGLDRKDAQLRALGSIPVGEAAAGFDRLRNEHPLRLEFRHFLVALNKSHIELAGTFRALGFETIME